MTHEELRELDSQVHTLIFPPREGVLALTEEVPAYSTDIAMAWRVIDKILDIRFPDCQARNGMTNCKLLFNPYENTWECSFSWSSAYKVRVWDESAPIAICKAALKALESPDPQLSSRILF